jgi:glycerol-3-phosphate dehydrogenase
LRYLEQYEFRLVRESLAEREVVLRQAPHIVEPLSFVLPHEPHLRPAWMLRAGLFMYDHLGRRDILPGSFGVDLSVHALGRGLKAKFGKGFVYSDARVDDARLVVFNVMDASLRGARVLVRTTLVSARRERDGSGPFWSATLGTVGRDDGRDGQSARQCRRAMGQAVRDAINDLPSKEDVRHIKGSHIIVPRVHEGAHAYILQNADKRIVFVIPYQERYTLIGTTDVAVDDLRATRDLGRRDRYLLELSNTYLAQPLARVDVVWTYSGVRPLYDDGASDPSSITRDYVFKLDTAGKAGAAALSIYGGKITTYRKLAEHALDDVEAPFLPPMRPRWTARAILPGGDLPGGAAAWSAELIRRFPELPASVLRSLARRHGTRALLVLGAAKKLADLGEDFGHGLFAARDRLRRARGVGARGRGRALAPDEVRHRHVRGRAQPRCGVRDEARRGGGLRPRAVMQPLAAMPDASRRAIRGVFADIDDTLTTHGRLTAQAYAALERLRAAGRRVIPITGRPAGWCDHIARMWPVDAVVGENGALYMRYDDASRRLVRRFADDEPTRRAHRAQLADIAEMILAGVPGCALASDQHYRETDLAIDFREDVSPLPAAAVDRIVALMQAAGMTAKVSSIHVNGWFGSYDKLTMTRTLMAEVFGTDIEKEREHFVFAGDSPNDAPMFAFFPNAVGVANVREFADRITTLPAYVTEAEAGAGFAELADFLLA